ncbi:hypothetical protein [Hydrogenophilus thiooxidans]|uniref:hypothetical protein n=1 Tax=Hydrogenophilus thiooxidans TaxID=2820326 RepID=UPI001C24F570|nr:hypothetical protein [Hydrogenophilus thiooxidans]
MVTRTPSAAKNPPYQELAEACQALRDALQRNAWEEAEAIAQKLLPLTAADREASMEGADAPARRDALRAAMQALEEARTHINPAYQSLRKLLIAWKALPSKPR